MAALPVAQEPPGKTSVSWHCSCHNHDDSTCGSGHWTASLSSGLLGPELSHIEIPVVINYFDFSLMWQWGHYSSCGHCYCHARCRDVTLALSFEVFWGLDPERVENYGVGVIVGRGAAEEGIQSVRSIIIMIVTFKGVQICWVDLQNTHVKCNAVLMFALYCLVLPKHNYSPKEFLFA